MSHQKALPKGSIAALVEGTTGKSPIACYQCGRCSAGCPQNVPGEMDVSPTRIMRLMQLETAFAEEPNRASSFAERALTADTPWLCAGCLACTTRCPKGVDIAGTMDVLRQEGMRRGIASTSKRARDIQALHKTFLSGAMGRGRIHELSMIGIYKMRTMNLFEDAMLGPAMFFKGKLHLLPPKAPGNARVRQAVARLRQSHKSPSHGHNH